MKGEFGSRESKKDRQFNGQPKNDKNPNNDLHNSTQKIKDLETHTRLKNRGFSRRVSSPVAPPIVLVKRHEHHLKWNSFVHQYVRVNTNNINKTLTPYKTNGSNSKGMSFTAKLENKTSIMALMQTSALISLVDK